MLEAIVGHDRGVLRGVVFWLVEKSSSVDCPTTERF